jgi:hypothetical protein
MFHADLNEPARKGSGKESAEIFSQIIKSNKNPVELLSVEGSE